MYFIKQAKSGSAGKESTCSVGDLASIPGLGRSPGEGKGYPLQYSGLENPMDYIVLDYSPWGRQESDIIEQLSLSISMAKLKMSHWHNPAISLLGRNLREMLIYKHEHLYVKSIYCGIIY